MVTCSEYYFLDCPPILYFQLCGYRADSGQLRQWYAAGKHTAGAEVFIEIISHSTGGDPTTEINSGLWIGIVSFANTAV